jgi:hypothetical protein
MNRKNKELASAELNRLRGDAKIEYLNKSMMPDAKTAPTPPAGSVAPAAGTPAARTPAARTPAAGAPDRDNSTEKAALDRGVAGLK